MTRKELNLAIFEGKANSVLWQPRLEEWINYNRSNNTMPERFKDIDDMAIYDTLRCSVRYAASAGIIRYLDPEPERFEKKVDESHVMETVRLPEGELHTLFQEVKEGGKLKNRRIVEFPVKNAEDLRVFTAFMGRHQFRIDIEAYEKAVTRVGKRAEPTCFISSSGFTDLIKWGAGLENAFYLLNDHQDVVEKYLEACDRKDDRELDAALKLPFRIYNLGDHATNEFSPPPILKRYLLPRWQKISRRMTENNRFVHSHWDGPARHILKFLQESGLHAVEALTPIPQGDITLEQIKEAVKDNIVVLDLIPALHFLPSYSVKEVIEFTKKAIDMFMPRLILGVSDEISGIGQIEKIEAISEFIDKTYGLAE